MKQSRWPRQKPCNQIRFAPVLGFVVAAGDIYFSSTVFTIGLMRPARDTSTCAASVFYVEGWGDKNKKRDCQLLISQLRAARKILLPSPISDAAAASSS